MYSASLHCCTGAAAATETAVSALGLLSVDSATVLPAAAKVAPGTNSYEKWLRVSIDSAGGLTHSNFWVRLAQTLPAGVVIKVGVATAGATPTAAASAVATRTLSAEKFLFDASAYDTDGDKTVYLVLQEQVAANAATGAVPTGALTFGWQAQ